MSGRPWWPTGWRISSTCCRPAEWIFLRLGPRGGPQPTPGTSRAFYCEAVPRPLIDAASLAARLSEQNPPTVLDVRWKLRAPSAYPDYLAGHVPGAAFVDLEQELC